VASVPVSPVYRIDDIEVDTARACLRRAGREIHLKPKAFQILVYLLAQRGRLISKEELQETFWKDTAVSEDVLAHSIADVRRALGDNARDSRYLKTVPKRGFRFVGEVQEYQAEAFISSITSEQITRIEVREEYSDEAPASDRLPRLLPARRRILGGIAFAATLCLAAALAGSHYWPSPSPFDLGNRTAIIQFENRSGNADMDWLRAGLPDMLATSLSRSPRIALITPGQLQRYLRSPSTDAIRPEDATRAARQAGAKVMISGAFALLGETVRVDAQIYDVSTGRLLGGETLTVDKPALLLAQMDPLAIKLAARLGAPLAGQQLAEVMTDNLEAYRLYSLGLQRTRNVQPAEAIELYRKAGELDPGFAMAYARMGFTYASTWGRPEEGKPYLERAYHLSDRLTPRDRLFIRAWYGIACRDYQTAERGYREILSAFPLEVEAYYSLGTLLAHDRRYDEARQIFERGLAIDRDMPQLYNQLHSVYFDLGQDKQAVEAVQRYVALSGEPNAYDSLALAYQRIGQNEPARESYLEAIRRKPDFDLAFLHLGNLYYQLGRRREALESYREFIRLAPSSVERTRGHLACAWAYWAKGDLANAEREAGEAARANNGQELNETLPIKADRGGLAFTDKLRDQVLAASTGRGGRGYLRIPYFIAGYVALRDHKTDEALKDFRNALTGPPVYWFIDPMETCLADALLELNRLDEAIAEYKRVLNVNPNYPMARYRLGLALDRKGMSREAHQEFVRFLTIWKDADAGVAELEDARHRIEVQPNTNPVREGGSQR
jgi:tetratricopeptide (TPR) repeat protein